DASGYLARMPRRCASTAGRCTDMTRSRIASTRLEPGAPDAVGWPGVPVSPGSPEDSTISPLITSSSRGSGCWSTVSAYVALGVRLLVSRRPLRGLLNQRVHARFAGSSTSGPLRWLRSGAAVSRNHDLTGGAGAGFETPASRDPRPAL